MVMAASMPRRLMAPRVVSIVRDKISFSGEIVSNSSRNVRRRCWLTSGSERRPVLLRSRLGDTLALDGSAPEPIVCVVTPVSSVERFFSTQSHLA
jgi:hypothetical protein